MTLSLDITKEYKTTTYEVNSDIYKDFLVDIVDDGENRNAWIYHKKHGMKNYMFGAPKKQDTLQKFLEWVRACVDDEISYLLEEEHALERYHEEEFLKMEGRK